MHSQSLLPVVISIVGHRDPIQSSVERNQYLFKSDLYKLAKAFPASPIYMLNGLACGMDLIAAEVFLNLCLENEVGCQHRLIGVLPKPLQEYKTEISEDEYSLFESTISSRYTYLLDPSNCMALRAFDDLGVHVDTTDDEECYLRQSLFLVEHSSVLFAFTDGVNNGKKGGTSYAVQIAKNQIYTSKINSGFAFNDHAPIGIVEYYTARLSSNDLTEPPFSVRYWKQQESKSDLWEITAAQSKVDLINRYFSKRISHLPANSSMTLWEFVDQMASEYKRRYQRGLLLFLALGFVTAMSLVRPGWQIIGMSIIVVSVYYLPWIQARFRENFIAFRCLAESLLILDDWFSFGIYCNPADLFRTSLHRDLEWVRAALRSSNVNLFVEQGADKINDSSDQLAAYQSRIEGQLLWLASSIRKQSKNDFRLLVAIGFVYVVACLSSLIFLLSNEQTLYKELFDWITESLMAFLVIAIGFRELMGFHEINARYARSITQIRIRLDAIKSACNSPAYSLAEQYQTIRHAVLAIGMEKMDELNDWVSDQLRRSYTP